MVRTVRPYDLDAGPFEQLQQAIPRLQKRIAEVVKHSIHQRSTRQLPVHPYARLKASIDDVLTRTFAHAPSSTSQRVLIALVAASAPRGSRCIND